jgi:HK97 family phage major capsid protein
MAGSTEPLLETRVQMGNDAEMAVKQPGLRSLRKGRFCCIRSFEDYEAGLTYVSRDHPALAAHPENFARYGTDAASTAIRSASKSEHGGAARPKSPTVAPTSEIRGKAPWVNSQDARFTPQIRRARVVDVDAIYDLSTVRGNLADPEPMARELRDRAMRAIERARFPHGRASAEQIRGHLAEMVSSSDDDHGSFCRRLLLTGSPQYRALFGKAAKGSFLTDEEKRALSLDGPSGGFAVPFTLDPTIIPTSSGVINPLRTLARTETTLTDIWKGVTSDGISTGYGTEGSEAEDNAPKLGQPELDMAKADAWIPAAFEVGQDWSGLEPAMAALLQRGKDELEADKFLTGDGEDKPFGLLTGATEVEETATKEVLAGGDLETIEEALPPGFLERGQWLGNRSIFKKIRHLPAEEGAPIWVKFPGEKPEINGLPANEISTMDATLEGGNSVLVLGDFSYFLIVDRIGMNILLIPEIPGDTGRPTGQLGVYAMWRNSSKVLSEDAFRVLKVKAS